MPAVRILLQIWSPDPAALLTALPPPASGMKPTFLWSLQCLRCCLRVQPHSTTAATELPPLPEHAASQALAQTALSLEYALPPGHCGEFHVHGEALSVSSSSLSYSSSNCLSLSGRFASDAARTRLPAHTSPTAHSTMYWRSLFPRCAARP